MAEDVADAGLDACCHPPYASSCQKGLAALRKHLGHRCKVWCGDGASRASTSKATALALSPYRTLIGDGV
jgi:hypothetical protein